MVTTIKVKSLGEDDFNRETYKNIENGRVYALVDGWYHTTTKDGEPESPLKRDIVVLIPYINENLSIGELLANYLCNKVKMMAVDSEEQAKEFVKSAKFHGVDAVYCFKEMSVDHPTKAGSLLSPKIHMVAERKVIERLLSKEGFMCPSLKI
jgi:hypothetical protein